MYAFLLIMACSEESEPVSEHYGYSQLITKLLSKGNVQVSFVMY